MKIRLLKSVAGGTFSYGKGSIVDAPQAIAEDLVRANLAVLVGESKPKQRAKSVAKSNYEKRG